MMNLHNEQIYADENPPIKAAHYQREFQINAWVTIIGNITVRPFQLPDRLNDVGYLHFFQEVLPKILHNFRLNLRRNIFFMHYGAPPHFVCGIRESLN